MLISGKDFWELKATHGLPLNFLYDELIDQRNIYPKWDEVYALAKADGCDIAKLTRELILLFDEHPDGDTFRIGFRQLEKRFTHESPPN